MGRRLLVRDLYCWDGGVINYPILLLFIESVCVCIYIERAFSTITLLRPIVLLCGIDSVLWNILHIHVELGDIL